PMVCLLSLHDALPICIDGSFNRGLAQAGDHRFFVQSMVQIAHSLDLQVLAEGVEQPADVQALQQVGVGGLSGYAFSRPSAQLQEDRQSTRLNSSHVKI